MEEYLPVYNKPSKEEILSLYEDYEWHDMLDANSPKNRYMWDPHHQHSNWFSDLQRKNRDWRFANGMLFIGTDAIDILSVGCCGEFFVKIDNSNVEASLILWHDYTPLAGLLAPGGHEQQHEKGVILKVSSDKVSLSYFAGPRIQHDFNVNPEALEEYESKWIAEAGPLFCRPRKTGEASFSLVVDRGAPSDGRKYPCHVYLDGNLLCEPFYAPFFHAAITIYSGVYKEIKFRGPEKYPYNWPGRKRMTVS